MKPIRTLKTLWTNLKTLSSWSRAWLSGSDSSAGNQVQLSNAMTQVPWVYAAITAKAAKLTQVALEVYPRAGEEALQGGPAVALLARPHPLLDSSAFVELLSVWLDLRGEFFLVGVDKAGGIVPVNKPGVAARIAALQILSPDQMTEIIEGHELVGWRYQTSGHKDSNDNLALLPEEVIHCRLPNPWNHWRGLSPLTVARVAAESDFTAAAFMRGLLANNADTGIIITTDQVLSPETQEQIKASLKERKRAAGTPDRPLLLHGGMKLEKPTLAAADLQFLENRKYLRQEILAVFRVPQEILGFTEDANRSVSESQAANWVQNVITPLARRIARCLSLITAPDEAWFDLDDLPEMQAMRRSRIDSAAKLFALGVPWNDIDRELDLGFGEYAWGEVGFLPYSVQPAMDVMEPAVTGERVSESASEPVGERKKGARPGHCCAPADPAWEAKHRREARLTKAKLQRFYFEQRSRILARLAENISPAKDAKNTKAEIDWEAIFDFAKEKARLEKVLKARMVATFEAGARDLLTELNMASFDLKPEAAIRFFERRQNMIAEITQDKFEQIKETLQEGLGNGESFEQLADRVRTEYSSFTDYQAERIAETETTMALNNGRMEGMTETGVKYKQWRTAKLEGVRASHLDAERRSAKGIPLDEPFSNGLMFPGDPDGPADEVINCRCFLAPVLERE